MHSELKVKHPARVSGYLPAILALSVFYLLVYYGLVHIEQQHRDLQLQSFTQQSSSLLEQMTLYADPEIFWVRRLNDDFRDSNGHSDFMSLLDNHQKAAGGRLTWIVWNSKGQVVADNHFAGKYDGTGVLPELFRDLNLLHNKGSGRLDHAVNRMRRILGPHLDLDKLAAALYYRHPKLVRPDSAGKFADFWTAVGGTFSAMVFFKREILADDSGLTMFCREFKEGGVKASFINTSRKALLTRRDELLTDAVIRLEREGRSSDFFDELMLAGKRIAGGKILVASKRYSSLLAPGRLAAFLALVSISGLLLILKSYGAGLGLNRCSVKLQLLLMLMVTTGLPLLCLAMAASDHVARKKTSLIMGAYQQCIEYLQHVESRSNINNAYMINRVNRSISAIKKILPGKFGTEEVINEIQLHIGDVLQDTRLIASSPAVVKTMQGIFANGRFTPFEVGAKLQSKDMLELKMLQHISAYYLSVVNNQPIDLDRFNETELLAEMVYQRPYHEIIQNIMLATDKIWSLGWGDRTNPVLVKLISLNDNLLIDYFYMIVFKNSVLQRDFIRRQVDNLDRNPLGLKFISSDGQYYSKELLKVADSPWFSEIIRKTRVQPSVEPQFTNYDGKPHVYAGMRSQNLSDFYFYAFYPLEKIDAQIAEEQRFMLSAGVVTIFLLVGLALVFSASFVSPLSALQAGAVAIRRRDFSYRLPEISGDEFGEMARVFNSSMADFEELSLAGIVQSRLLPQHGIADSRFDLYGRNIPMTELGGDYFDYFHVDGSSYVIMAGDVAGHGVGASLIMAMAKAGVMRCRDCIKDPAAVLSRLHQIIHETRTKVQRKIMTFQYVCYDAASG
ncbi:MAG: SpoIIE family protein phosphatase, partial [Candidatus Riflebacteria bacterium]|nr:SpoIIE family protein phosphatase [Candidatus Riflebacteria bacterium]